MARLACPNCGTPFVPEQVNLALGVGSCLSCNQVHELSGRAPGARERSPADPAGLELTEGSTPTLSFAWRGWILVFLLAWTFVWDAILVGVLLVAITSGAPETLLFTVFHVVTGVGMTYLTLATALNRTTLALEGERLTVTHGPLPWFGGQSVAREEIRQIYVREDRGSKGSRSWSVHALVTPGHPVRLVRGLSSAGRARALETWLERHLGVVDAPVSGEHA